MDRREGSDEPHARQQDGARPQPPGHSGYGVQPSTDPNAMNASWMEGTVASPYYGAPSGRTGAGPPPHYGRPYGQQPYGDPAMAASMYARHHPAQAYGYAPPQGPDRYGYAPAHQEMYMRHYGVPIPRGQPHGSQLSPHGGIPSSVTNPSPPNSAIAALACASAAQSTTKTPSKSSPGSNSEGETPKSGGDDSNAPTTPAFFGGFTASPKSSMKKSSAAKLSKKSVAHEVTELEDLHIDKWYSGSIPLGLEDDKYWLSELQVYLRANFAEAFGATEEDIAAPMHGRNKPIALGQVGIRCVWCKHENPAERGQQATSYPSLISGIYNSVQQMLRLHLDCCQAMPPDVRAKIESLKMSSSSRGGRKQYWVDSAKRLGLVDTRHGIHFCRDPYGPLPPLAGPSVNTKEGRRKKEAQKKESRQPEEQEEAAAPPPIVDDRPLVFPEDKDLISDYLFLTLEQMSPCVLMEADRVGCYKGRKVGFPGLACKWCVGQAGCGRYFPASEASLSQTTTSQTILNHVRNCRRCPLDIRENLEVMKRARMGPDGRRADKPKHGGRKVFFHRLWCRIQGLPIDDNFEDKERKKPGRKPKKRDVDMVDGDDGNVGTSSDEETESESSDESDDEGDEEGGTTKVSGKSKKGTGKGKFSPWWGGCVRLTKPDDSQWLSEMQCFARSDLVEVFAWRNQDGLAGYNGRKDPAEGQVAVRCAFCKTLPPVARPSGTLVFPEKVDGIQTKVEDMLRLHFHSCPGMPPETKDTLKTLKNFGPKKGDDPHQYWVDSARDIGLSNLPPGNTTGWGITFRRDPFQPSPCEDLDRELEEGNPAPELSKVYLIRPEDRGECTDQVFLMMRQVKVCRFQQRDRRGSNSRGRDRVLDFPGLACKHCANKNNIGRYFPVSAKNLTDNTANSMLSHVSSCSRCPETVKASLAYLSHRAVLQKAELGGSWKKLFFKKIWDRLHTEREWVEAIEEEEGSIGGGDVDDADDSQAGSTSAAAEEEEEGSESGDGQPSSNNMNALIKAAAIWLTKDEKTKDGSGGKSSRSRSLPGRKRGTEKSPSRDTDDNFGDGNDDGSGKRRRVAV
ncbi:hypothetical protein IV203_013164 [Nitzschia inconspicua]|uniref:Uncharacterized protein n=1 Tax=Nitzschia inconspicua TaxID=303405 RepID=A0A9K3Q9Z9_9STRA|nr:hypothetical protein IV203_013164 [Nitzschia inconspicua]